MALAGKLARGGSASSCVSLQTFGNTMTVKNNDYAVADMSLAAYGRKELDIAEAEMPGLMATRANTARNSAEGRTYCRFAPHDHSDGRADRDAEGARRRRALGLLQHLFDAGPCCRRDCRQRHAGFRDQGREPLGLLGFTHRSSNGMMAACRT